MGAADELRHGELGTASLLFCVRRPKGKTAGALVSLAGSVGGAGVSACALRQLLPRAVR